MKEKIAELRKKMKETRTKVAIGILAIVILVSVIFNFMYIFVVLAFALMFYFIKQAEKESETIKNSMMEEELSLRSQEQIEKLQRKINIIKAHLEIHDDLEAKIKLYELEEEVRELEKNVKENDFF